MIRAKSLDEYIDWVKQAIFEIKDLRAAVEYYEEYMGDALVFINPLENDIKKTLRRSY